MNRDESPGSDAGKPVGDKAAYLSDIGSAMDSLKEHLAGGAKRLMNTYEHLQRVIDFAGEWMEPSDLKTLRDKIVKGDASLNGKLEEVWNQFGELIPEVYAIVDRMQHTRGYFLHPIKPSRRLATCVEGSTRPPEPGADVIFVHGLDGSAFDTWQYDPKRPIESWPFWMADHLSHVNVWTLGYPAASRDRKRKQGLALETIAKGSLDALKDKDVGKRPLVFVAHSLGGLVVKKMTQLSHSHVDPNHKDRFLKDSLRGVVFLGTPHSGSSLGTIAHNFRTLYRATVTIEYLRKDNATIDELGKWFREYADRDRNLIVHAHRETVKLVALKFLKFLVVDPASADPGIPQAEVFDSAEKDHITICKCRSHYEAVYQRTRDMILAIAPQPRGEQLQLPSPRDPLTTRNSE